MNDDLLEKIIRINTIVRNIDPVNESPKELISKKLRKDIFDNGYDRIKLLRRWISSKNNVTIENLNFTCELIMFIILFQVFGDGNHRTSTVLLEECIKRKISPDEYKTLLGITDSTFTESKRHKHYYGFSLKSDEEKINYIKQNSDVLKIYAMHLKPRNHKTGPGYGTIFAIVIMLILGYTAISAFIGG